MKDKIPTLTRKDIARDVAEQLSVRLQDADHIVDTVLTSIREMLMNADPELRLEVRDFGVFEIKLTKAKPRARNPKTGDKVYVPPRRKSHFKPSKLLKSFLKTPLSSQAEARLLERELLNPVTIKKTVEDFIAQ
jgi:integration host factor subunit beta